MDQNELCSFWNSEHKSLLDRRANWVWSIVTLIAAEMQTPNSADESEWVLH